MKMYFKSDRWCSCYTCLPHSSPAAQTALKTVATPDTGTPLKDQRLLTIATPKQVQHIHATKANGKKQYNNTKKQQTKLS